MKKHKHADVIIAWAYGSPVQVWSEKYQRWEDRANPVWLEEWHYRVKPFTYDVSSNKFVTPRGVHG